MGTKIKKREIFDLYNELSNLSDTRRNQGKRHKIEFVVMIVILSIMGGYNGYRATGDFIKKNSEELIKLFKPKKNRLPSFDTVRKVMSNINFEELNNIFEKWTKDHIEIGEKEWISLDGKTIKGTMPEEEHKFINLVSLFFISETPHPKGLPFGQICLRQSGASYPAIPYTKSTSLS